MFRPIVVAIFKEVSFERCIEQFLNLVVRVNKLLLTNPSNITDLYYSHPMFTTKCAVLIWPSTVIFVFVYPMMAKWWPKHVINLK